MKKRIKRMKKRIKRMKKKNKKNEKIIYLKTTLKLFYITIL
jgi:hypothetical protein